MVRWASASILIAAATPLSASTVTDVFTFEVVSTSVGCDGPDPSCVNDPTTFSQGYRVGDEESVIFRFDEAIPDGTYRWVFGVMPQGNPITDDFAGRIDFSTTFPFPLDVTAFTSVDFFFVEAVLANGHLSEFTYTYDEFDDLLQVKSRSYTGPFAFYQLGTGGPNQATASFDLTNRMTAVPLPGAGLVFAAGLCALAAARSGDSKDFRDRR